MHVPSSQTAAARRGLAGGGHRSRAEGSLLLAQAAGRHLADVRAVCLGSTLGRRGDRPMPSDACY